MGVQARMDRRYDLVVLGGGTAGLIASVYATRIGARVALVEQAEQPGGDCLFTGCVPSKSLIASAQLAHDMRTAERLGLEASEPSIDFAGVMERVQEVIRRAGVRDTAEHLESEEVEVVRALGRFARLGVVEAGGRALRYRAAIIATQLIGRGTVRAAGSCRALLEEGPHVGDVVLGYRRREHGRPLLVSGGASGEGFDGRLRLPALKEVDAARVEQVGRDGKVEAAICSASLFDNADGAREVGLALLRVDRDVSCDDDHGCVPFRSLRVSRHLPSRTHRQHERPKLIKGFLCEQLAWTRAQDASGPRSTEQQRGVSAE
jgi:hypothetical protein